MLRTATVAILAGAVILHYLPELPPGWLLWLAPFVFALLLFCKSRPIKLLLFFTAGFLWAHFQASCLLQHRLPADYIGRDITVLGHIASLPKRTSSRVSFDFDVDQFVEPELRIAPVKLRLSWYFSAYLPPVKQINAGDRWQFTVRLKPPRNFSNPGSFDYSGWLLQKKILETGYIKNHSQNKLLESSQFAYPLQRLRQDIRAKLVDLKLDPAVEPFLRALIIGDRTNLVSKDWAILKNTGTVHLMAISGLHIGLIAGAAFFLTRVIWSCFPFLVLRFAAPRVAAITAWFCACIYAGMAGFSLPTQRALIMLSIVLLSVVLNRITSPLTVLCLSLLTILFLDSFAVLSISFWLSFAAVALIIYFIYLQESAQQKLKKWIALQVLLSLGLLPLSVLFFQQASIISPVANLVAIPVIGFIVVPLCFLGTALLFINTSFAYEIFNLASWVFNLLWQILDWLARLPFGTFTISTPGLWTAIIAGFGCLLLVFPRVFRLRILALLCISPVLFPFHKELSTKQVIITVLDVGQGLATVIQTKSHAMIFDTGPRFNQYFDTGRAVVLPFLREKGIRRLDKLLISHSDNDHIGGTNSIMTAMPVDTVLTSVPGKLNNYPSRRCERGQHWQWDGVQFEILHPDRNDYLSGLYSENNLSCVLQISSGQHSILLTADIEEPAESLLVSRYKNRLASQVMVAPHHGSKTSSSEAFIKAVNPGTVVIPAGWHNRYHFPHQTIIERYARHQCQVLTTAEQGAVSIRLGHLEISSFRDQFRHYWEQR